MFRLVNHCTIFCNDNLNCMILCNVCMFQLFVMMDSFFNYCTTFCNNNMNYIRLYNLSIFQVYVLQYIWLTDTDPLTDSHTPILEMLSHLKTRQFKEIGDAFIATFTFCMPMCSFFFRVGQIDTRSSPSDDKWSGWQILVSLPSVVVVIIFNDAYILDLYLYPITVKSIFVTKIGWRIIIFFYHIVKIKSIQKSEFWVSTSMSDHIPGQHVLHDADGPPLRGHTFHVLHQP